MAAAHPAVSRAIAQQIGEPHPPKGALSALARKLNRNPSVISRWYAQQSSPDPDHWPAIEDALGFERGYLQSIAFTEAVNATPPEVLLLVREVLRELEQLRRDVGALKAERDGAPKRGPRR